MAKKRRAMAKQGKRRPRFGHITGNEVDAAEGLMNWTLKNIRDYDKSGSMRQYDSERFMFTGMAQMVNALGIRCSCMYPDGRTKKRVCLCAKNSKELKAKILDKTGYRPSKPEITLYHRDYLE